MPYFHTNSYTVSTFAANAVSTYATVSYSTTPVTSDVVYYINGYPAPPGTTITFETTPINTTSTAYYTWANDRYVVTWQHPGPVNGVEYDLARYGPRESDEDRAAREAEVAEWRRQADERQAQRDQAIIEAEALLWACLDTVQRGELAITDSFIVTGSSGKRYRIRRGYAGNVEDFEGENIYSYCGHAYVEGMPEADQMLAQKFALETNEENYLQIANASFLRPGTVEERQRGRRSA